MIKKTLALLALAVVTTTAQAGTSAPAHSGKGVIAPTIEPDSISYSNASLGYLRNSAQLAGFSTGSNGIAAALEYSPVNNLYVAAGGSFSEFRTLGQNDDYWTANAGVGGYIPLTGNIHFVTEVGASYIQGAGAGNDWGLYVTPHIRAKFGKFETHLGATYNSNDLALDEWTGFLRLLYEVAPNMDLYATGTIGLTEDNADSIYGLQAGLRFKF
ncbi:MAG: hypothetical protein NTV80_24055 [Verrucomicrobia bacterium]|nr:hypothetical protein [Verrucomicrobiota bacterium]